MPGMLLLIRCHRCGSARKKSLSVFGNQKARPQLCTMPSTMAPAKVMGRLRSFPKTAAP